MNFNKTAMIRVASINLRGINKKEKMLFLNDFLKSKHIKICFLQETHIDSQDVIRELEEACNGFFIFSTINELGKTKGVAILISKGLQELEIIGKSQDLESRIINLEIEIQKEKINLVNIYAPNLENEQIAFINSLYNFLAPKKRVLMAGDFNSVIRANDRIGGCTDKTLKKSDKEWIKFYKQLGFKEINWKNSPTVEDFWTWSDGHVFSRLDRVYIKNDFLNEIKY